MDIKLIIEELEKLSQEHTDPVTANAIRLSIRELTSLNICLDYKKSA